MSRVEEKLNHFANDVMSDVGEERLGLLTKVDQELAAIYDAKENEYLQSAYETIQAALIKIDQKKNESMSRIIMGNRTRLFETRNEIMERIVSKAVERLRAYKDMEAYKTWLITRIKTAEELLGDGELSVIIDYSDSALVDFLAKETGILVVLESKKVDMIGGCKIMNKTSQTIVDYGFATKLNEVREEFMQLCQLAID